MCSIRDFFGDVALFLFEELRAVTKVARNQIEVTSRDIFTFLRKSGTGGLSFFGGVGGSFVGVGGTCFGGGGGAFGGGGGGYDGTLGRLSSSLIVLILMYWRVCRGLKKTTKIIELCARVPNLVVSPPPLVADRSG